MAGHLLEKNDYPYALFLGHLAIEKLLKALFVSKFDEPPPFTHRLLYLAEKAGLRLSQENLELLEIITDFNLEARYPDEKFSFHKKCTKEFTENYMEKIEEIRKWLQQVTRKGAHARAHARGQHATRKGVSNTQGGNTQGGQIFTAGARGSNLYS